MLAYGLLFFVIIVALATVFNDKMEKDCTKATEELQKDAYKQIDEYTDDEYTRRVLKIKVDDMIKARWKNGFVYRPDFQQESEKKSDVKCPDRIIEKIIEQREQEEWGNLTPLQRDCKQLYGKDWENYYDDYAEFRRAGEEEEKNGVYDDIQEIHDRLLKDMIERETLNKQEGEKNDKAKN